MKERDEDYKSRFLTDEQLRELDEIMDEHERQHLVYAPNSIHHGCINGAHFKDSTLLRIEIGKLNDFIRFLFEDSEYCDHANESDAWDEFNQYEFSKLLNSEQEDKRSVKNNNDGI